MFIVDGSVGLLIYIFIYNLSSNTIKTQDNTAQGNVQNRTISCPKNLTTSNQNSSYDQH